MNKQELRKILAEIEEEIYDIKDDLLYNTYKEDVELMQAVMERSYKRLSDLKPAIGKETIKTYEVDCEVKMEEDK
jgi:cob(I)alamin adenosyltransferase